MTTFAIAYPMHGQHKLSNEGYRTRDGHMIEWLGRFASTANSHVDVISRPEPIVLAPTRRIKGSVAVGTKPIQTITWRFPKLDPKHWWVRSVPAYPLLSSYSGVPVVNWNPFVATTPANRNPFRGGRKVAFDLLDDWTVHKGFASIRSEVEEAYRRAFEASSVVFANSEGTLALAHRFGRTDAELVTNGVDPERFTAAPNAHGPITVGYVGKIGHRLNGQLLSDVCSSFPSVRFVFAGPFLDQDKSYQKLLSAWSNVEILGDVHYEDVPALMATFDLGWVPHAVGEGEVGGDVIKTYEYRASGLQVLTTPVIGAGRELTEGVHVVPAADQVAWLHEAIRGRERIERVPANIPAHLTWRYKAGYLARALDLAATS